MEIRESRSVKIEREMDVIVAGAGVAGVFAALAAARMGQRTLLVDRFGSPGGNIGPGMIAGGSLSGWPIPHMLRGPFFGIPKEFIKYMHSLAAGDAIPYYSCFISYSTKDQEFADRLYADLHANGVHCWFAPSDIKGGRKLHEQIPEAIRLYDKLLLLLSENSMNSEWVKTEIYHARQDEIRNKKRKLFPIGLVPFTKIREWEAFDADVGKDMAREVREYFIPDFSNWKDYDSYQRAFDRLLRDLKADESPAATEDE